MTMETASQLQETAESDNPDSESKEEFDYFKTEIHYQFQAYFRKLEAAGLKPGDSLSQISPEFLDRYDDVGGFSSSSSDTGLKKAKDQPSDTGPKKAKDQPSQSEAWKKQAQEEAEAAKKQLAEMSEKLQDSHRQLYEISVSVGSRLEELRRISLDCYQVWESEPDAVQKHHSMDSAGLDATVLGVTVQLDVAQVAIVKMEKKLRRLRVQSNQWRKEVEEVAAMLSGKKLNSPFSEYLQEDSPKKKNCKMLKKFGVFMKKGYKKLLLHTARPSGT